MANVGKPFYQHGTGVRVTQDHVRDLRDAIKLLTGTELLVGFPEKTTVRDPNPQDKSPLTNAAIAYIQDNGAPEANIPARPFMLPGMLKVQEKVAGRLTVMAKAVLNSPRPEAVEKAFTAIGLIIQASIQGTIRAGIPPPLAYSTVAERARRGRTGALWEKAWRDAGAPPSLELAKPLVDTAQLLKSVNFVTSKRLRGSLWQGSILGG